jgi:hypothetical protein
VLGFFRIVLRPDSKKGKVGHRHFSPIIERENIKISQFAIFVVCFETFRPFVKVCRKFGTYVTLLCDFESSRLGTLFNPPPADESVNPT